MVKIHLYERIVVVMTVAFLAIALLAIGGAVVFAHISLPGEAQKIDPQRIHDTPPFDRPGLREVGPGIYEVAMIAQTWSFDPSEIVVPVGSTVTFRVATADVTHGFLIQNTNVNLTLVPGFVATATARFDQPGTYLLVCHEYCGLGHHNMYARVVVQ
jgi:cytochrome c oxidase subunit II